MRKLIKEHRWSLIACYVLILGVSVFAAVRSEQNAKHQNTIIKEQRHLIKENTQRIRDIQQSRAESCRTNYETVIHAFDPFKPTKDDPTTQRDEVQDFKDFQDALKKKEAKCPMQVKIKERK